MPSTLSEVSANEMAAADSQPVEFVELCRPPIFPVAMLIKQMLEQNGVAALVQGGHSLSVMPHLVFGGELRVMVDSQQLDYARALYHAYFHNDGDIDFLDED
ncbi:MAG TPA: hypothetical protein VNO70_17370 [Blastocatellia bacterium]|nr:hypothetical protein [Blastocatellia bacterium]